MGVKKSERGSGAVGGNAQNAGVSVVVGNIFHEPVDGVVGVGRFVGGFGIGGVDPGGKIEDTLGFKASAKILDDEDVSVLRQFLHEGGHLLGRFVGDAIGSAAEQDGERCVVVAGLRNRSEDDG